jgi:hypothetical protein
MHALASNTQHSPAGAEAPLDQPSTRQAPTHPHSSAWLSAPMAATSLPHCSSFMLRPFLPGSILPSCRGAGREQSAASRQPPAASTWHYFAQFHASRASSASTPQAPHLLVELAHAHVRLALELAQRQAPRAAQVRRKGEVAAQGRLAGRARAGHHLRDAAAPVGPGQAGPGRALQAAALPSASPARTPSGRRPAGRLQLPTAPSSPPPTPPLPTPPC